MPSDHQSKHGPPLPWSAFLDELDQPLSEPIALHCIGGFVVSLLYGLPRPTGDIDYIAAIPRHRLQQLEDLAGRGSKLEAKYKVHLQHVTVATMPEDYEARLREGFRCDSKSSGCLRRTHTISSYPNSSGTVRRTKAMSNTSLRHSLCIQRSCKNDMFESCVLTSWHARPGTTAP
jgi:hypothetical protein